jgi:hypothetical protein
LVLNRFLPLGGVRQAIYAKLPQDFSTKVKRQMLMLWRITKTTEEKHKIYARPSAPTVIDSRSSKQTAIH